MVVLPWIGGGLGSERAQTTRPWNGPERVAASLGANDHATMACFGSGRAFALVSVTRRGDGTLPAETIASRRHILLLLGERTDTKRAAVARALADGQLGARNFQVFAPFEGMECAPSYSTRLTDARSRWHKLLYSVESTQAAHSVVLASWDRMRDAGPELVFGYDEVHEFVHGVSGFGGRFTMACAIDDVFAHESARSTTEIRRQLLARHLEVTEAQRLATRLSVAEATISPLMIMALQGSRQNLLWALVGLEPRGSVYLKYPINAFRRNPQHPAREELDRFRAGVASLGGVVYDPLSIDEEFHISGVADSEEEPIPFPPERRFSTLEQELLLETMNWVGRRVEFSSDGWAGVSRTAKAQVPEQDFYWIDASDTVVSWRPFLDRRQPRGSAFGTSIRAPPRKERIGIQPTGRRRRSSIAVCVHDQDHGRSRAVLAQGAGRNEWEREEGLLHVSKPNSTQVLRSHERWNPDFQCKRRIAAN